MTTQEVADRWGVTTAHVVALIHSGELKGFNVSAGPLRKKPRWRIHEADVVDFERRRSGAEPKKPQPKRRRQPTAEIVEFFK